MQYINEEISKAVTILTNNYVEAIYLELRTLVISRLTLYNAWHGDEATWLTLTDYEDARNGVWLPRDHLTDISEEGKFLIGFYKLAYLSGKGKRDVTLLIPNNIIQAMALLLKYRKEYGVYDNSIFFFGNKRSYKHAQRWQLLQKVGSKAGIVINATTNRHALSTHYASPDMAEADRAIFFYHMGHDQRISKENYRAKNGMKTLSVMGPQLEKGEFIYLCNIM